MWKEFNGRPRPAKVLPSSGDRVSRSPKEQSRAIVAKGPAVPGPGPGGDNLPHSAGGEQHSVSWDGNVLIISHTPEPFISQENTDSSTFSPQADYATAFCESPERLRSETRQSINDEVQLIQQS